jgi:hypothetical protein
MTAGLEAEDAAAQFNINTEKEKGKSENQQV